MCAARRLARLVAWLTLGDVPLPRPTRGGRVYLYRIEKRRAADDELALAVVRPAPAA